MTPTLDWIDLVSRGDTVKAIVAYRAQMGVGLGEAKDAVERWVAANLPPPLDYQLAARAATRLHDRLAGYAATVRPIAYSMWVVADHPDRHSGHPAFLNAVLSVSREGIDLEVLFPLSGVPRRLWRDEAHHALARGTPLVFAVDVEEASVAVFDNRFESRTYLVGATLDGGDVLPGFACKVAELFE